MQQLLFAMHDPSVLVKPSGDCWVQGLGGILELAWHVYPPEKVCRQRSCLEKADRKGCRRSVAL